MAQGIAAASLIDCENPCPYTVSHIYLFSTNFPLWGYVGGWNLVQLPIPAYKAKQPFTLSFIPTANLELPKSPTL